MHLVSPFATTGARMDPNLFRSLAQRCRDLAVEARTDVTKRQLLMWADEFEAQATEVERQRCDDDGC
jgi:hypothetical protein